MRPQAKTPEDFDALAALAQEAGASGWSASALADSARHPTGRTWLVARGGALRGFLLGRVVADEAEILLIAVARSDRRAGLGRALWHAFEEEVRGEGAASVHLEVADDNPGAARFYEALGFERVGRRAAYYDSGADAILMRRRLEP